MVGILSDTFGITGMAIVAKTLFTVCDSQQ